MTSKSLAEKPQLEGHENVLLLKRRGLINLTLEHKHTVSYDNGYYDWGLITDKIELARKEFTVFFDLALNNKLSDKHYLTALYSYFQVVYDETFRVWQERKAEIRRQNVIIVTYPYHTIESTKLYTKELAWINERWRNWQYKENEFIDIDNEINDTIGEVDYSHFTLPDNIIRDSSFVIRFGKYSKNGALGKYQTYTVKDLMTIDPQYLLWMHHNTDGKFQLSEELLREVTEWSEHHQQVG